VGVDGVGNTRGVGAHAAAKMLGEGVEVGSTGEVLADVQAAGNCRELCNGVRLGPGSGILKEK